MLTLKEAFEKTIAMYEYVVERFDVGTSVHFLKAKYLENVAPGDIGIASDCYFCAYAFQHSGDRCAADFNACGHCPGRSVAGDCWTCTDDRWDYEEDPAAFLAEIKRLEENRV